MRARMTPWGWARLVGGAAILAVVVARVGTGPFADAVRLTNAGALAVAALVGLATTACCAWRWSLVARGLDVAVPLPAAVGACYRSQFLNVTLPGGVLGDVHRGVAHGRQAGELGRGRARGRVGALGRAGRAGRAHRRCAARPGLAGECGRCPRSRPCWPPRRWSGCWSDGPSAAPGSCAPRPTTYAGACWAPDSGRASCSPRPSPWPGTSWSSWWRRAPPAWTLSPARVLPLGLIVLLASAVPTNIAGWGPREGAAAWAFGAAGLGAATGATVAIVYGVMVLFAALPGAVLLLAGWLAGKAPQLAPAPEGARHG